MLAGLDDALARLDSAAASPNPDDAIITTLVHVALAQRGLPRLWQLESRHLREQDRAAVLVRATRITRHVRRAIRSRRPELSAAEVDSLSWCALSVAVSPAYHRVELPLPMAAHVLRATIRAVITTDLSTAPTTAARAESKSDQPLGPELDRGQRRERILAEAARLFTVHGFPDVSIHDIGAAAGVTGPAVYHYFDSKAGLLDVIVRSHDASIEDLFDETAIGALSPTAALATLTRGFVQFGADEPDLLAITVSETRHLPAAAEHRYRSVRQEAIARWARVLSTARPELAPPIARMLIRALTTVVIEAVRNPRLSRRGDLVEVLVAVGHSIQSTPAVRAHYPTLLRQP
ncbi:TetR/AcrR family transcriptional regulator [Nocardia sp. NPDC056952]|uniref:TetR/AcrR family transcriptional regulator n=1 Tax=Nocardia sp. NPDC056952 TaxID=3345979 RepID=UPI0036405E38